MVSFSSIWQRLYTVHVLRCRADGQWLEGAYLALASAAGVDHDAHPTQSYSFQFTTRWMLLVPRTAAESSQGVGCNTVGYAGAALMFAPCDLFLLARNHALHLQFKVPVLVCDSGGRGW